MTEDRHKAQRMCRICGKMSGPDPQLCSATMSRSQAPVCRSHSLTVPSSELDKTRPLQNCRHVTADWCLLGPERNIIIMCLPQHSRYRLVSCPFSEGLRHFLSFYFDRKLCLTSVIIGAACRVSGCSTHDVRLSSVAVFQIDH